MPPISILFKKKNPGKHAVSQPLCFSSTCIYMQVHVAGTFKP